MQVFGLDNGKRCDWGDECDPFVELTVNGKPIKMPGVKPESNVFDLNFEYSAEVPKNSLIDIRVWDDDDLGKVANFLSFNSYEKKELILQTRGNIQSFINNPKRTSANVIKDENTVQFRNSLNTYVFWEDKYEEEIEQPRPQKRPNRRS